MVQDAADRLLRDGEIEISVEAAGYRSSFVGAVLASLPAARGTAHPRSAVLDHSATSQLRRAWREPPEVEDAIDSVVELAGRGPARVKGQRQLAAERKAIEMHAIWAATVYFEKRGWDVEYVGDVASYDLDCTSNGRTLHVEVKGTTSLGGKILLPRNEVRHAKGTDKELALYVLSKISLSVDGDSGRPIAEGGEERVFNPWHVEDADLEPVGYEYALPIVGLEV